MKLKKAFVFASWAFGAWCAYIGILILALAETEIC
jgi:hypothetical protein